jgi:hypothetical protein
MQSLNEAINVLKKKVKGAKPVSYWKKGTSYVFRLANTDVVGCNFYRVEGDKVTGTNPIQADLVASNMKPI